MSTHRPDHSTIVLVVEDEVLIREDVIDALEQEGFDVLRAATADDALAILRRRPDIQAVFTDVQMPGQLDGVDLARHLAAWHPDVVVLVTSGRSYAPPPGLPAASRFLPKPYMPRSVAEMLREMVASEGNGWDPGFGGADGNRGSPASPH